MMLRNRYGENRGKMGGPQLGLVWKRIFLQCEQYVIEVRIILTRFFQQLLN